MNNTVSQNPIIDPNSPPAVYEWTGPTGVKFRDVLSAAGTYYHDTTPARVVEILDGAMHTGRRLRFFYGDKVTGWDWAEENDVCGTIGRSTGWKKTALLIANSRSTGGGVILADCILRIVENGREIYRAANYQSPKFETVEIQPGTTCGNVDLRAAGYTHAVRRANDRGEFETVANFKSAGKAARWVEFMTGRRMSK